MGWFKPSDFTDGEDVEISNAIKHANRLKLVRSGDVAELYYDTDKPYFCHVYWSIQLQYDIEVTNERHGEIWDESMNPSNWKSVYKWLVKYSDLFVKSANQYDSNQGIEHPMLNGKSWTVADIQSFKW